MVPDFLPQLLRFFILYLIRPVLLLCGALISSVYNVLFAWWLDSWTFTNRGRRGRKKDFRDAERLVKRLVGHELTLSFVPDVEERLWRTVVRTKYQLTRNRVQLQNRLEALLEEAHIKLSSLVPARL